MYFIFNQIFKQVKTNAKIMISQSDCGAFKPVNLVKTNKNYSIDKILNQSSQSSPEFISSEEPTGMSPSNLSSTITSLNQLHQFWLNNNKINFSINHLIDSSLTTRTNAFCK